MPVRGGKILPCEPGVVCGRTPVAAVSPTVLERWLRLSTVVTMLLTIPQVVRVWSDRGGSGVSLVSWLAYLATSFAWLLYGVQKRDRMIYLTFAGWIVLDAAIVGGIIAMH